MWVGIKGEGWNFQNFLMSKGKGGGGGLELAAGRMFLTFQ